MGLGKYIIGNRVGGGVQTSHEGGFLHEIVETYDRFSVAGRYRNVAGVTRRERIRLGHATILSKSETIAIGTVVRQVLVKFWVQMFRQEGQRRI